MVSAHPANCIRCSSNIAIADHFPSKTFSFAHHLTGKAWRVFFFLPAFGQCCPSISAHPANCIRCSSNIAIADNFPSKTFSFKHHLTGEAWPASLQSNSTFSSHPKCFASGTVPKNRHLRSAEKHPGDRLCTSPTRLCPGDRCARRR